MRVYPAPALLVLVALWGALAVAVAFWPTLKGAWLALAALAALVSLADYLRLRRTPSPTVERVVARNLPVGSWCKVELQVRNEGTTTLNLTLHDLHPAAFEVRGMPVDLTLAPRQFASIRYHLRPPRRGANNFAGTELLLSSPLQLWRQRRRLGEPEALRVYPNFAEIAHYTLLATDNNLSRLGVRRRQRRGEGADFHQLREYRRGDSLRQVDWNATSRYRKLISREYQDERDQQILFLVDCGHRMRHEDDGLVHIDEALNAVLLLSYVALRQGDAVGLMSFGGQQRWFAPRKGTHVVNALLDATYDLEASSEAADYLSAASQVLSLQRRRALVVVITNARDEDRSDLEAAVRLLRQRHLVVVADLREAVLDELMTQPVSDLDDALTFQSGQSYLAARRRAHDMLGHLGARILDVRPAQLPVALVNQYFAIKRSGTL